jgi:hypothetical protein
VCVYILQKYVKSFFSDVLRRWTDSATTVLPIITELLSNNIRVWVYRYGQQLSPDASVSLMQHFELEIDATDVFAAVTPMGECRSLPADTL